MFVCSLLTTVSCSKSSKSDDLNSNILRADWLNANLNPTFSKSQQLVSGYLFKPQDLQELISRENVDLVRFVLSYRDEQINFSAVGVDINGNELISFNSEPYLDDSFSDNLLNLKNSQATIFSDIDVVRNHILKSDMAYNYLFRWQNELKNANNLNELTSYNGVKIHHFSLRKEVVQDMLNIQNISNIGLFIGVNTENKITTVFSGLDSNNRIILPQISGNSNSSKGAIYDFTTQCPKDCDINSSNIN